MLKLIVTTSLTLLAHSQFRITKNRFQNAKMHEIVEQRFIYEKIYTKKFLQSASNTNDKIQVEINSRSSKRRKEVIVCEPKILNRSSTNHYELFDSEGLYTCKFQHNMKLSSVINGKNQPAKDLLKFTALATSIESSLPQSSFLSYEPSLSPSSTPTYALSNLPTSSTATPSARPSNTISNFTIYVQGNRTDAPADSTQCSFTSKTPLSSCTLRSAWALCNELQASLTTICKPITCTIVLPAYSTQTIENLKIEGSYPTFGTLTFQTSYNPPNGPPTTCPNVLNEFNIVGETTSSDSLPVVQGVQSNDQFINFVGFSSGSTLALRNLVIRNFGNGNNNGGAAYLGMLNVRIDNCIFSSNWGFGGGGAIALSNYYNAQISNSVFDNNINVGVSSPTSTYGAPGATTITDNTFPPPSTTGSNSGGAILAQSAEGRTTSTVISNTVFSSNRGSNGGGVLVLYGLNESVEIINCTFSNNVANGPGGAIITSNCAASVFIFNSTFSNNIAGVNSVTKYNQYPFHGGAIYVVDSFGGEAKLLNCIFTNNTADSGGAIFLDGDSKLTLDSSKFIGNFAHVDNGGAIYLSYSPSIYINDVIFSRNHASIYGGAIYSINSPFCTVSNSHFIENIASLSGGALAIEQSDNWNFFNNVLQNNDATYANGGAIYLTISKSTIVNSTFMSNSANYGGAIFDIKSLGASIQDCKFVDNNALYDAGAIEFVTSPSAQIHRSTFKNNSATSYYSSGGAVIFASGSSNAAITDTEFVGNSANSGGAVINYCDSFTISTSVFTDNRATTDGGAIIVANIQSLIWRDNKFLNNVGGNNGGAVYAINCSVVSIKSNLFVRNSAAAGGALYIQNSANIEMLQSIFHECTAATYSGAVHTSNSKYMVVSSSSFSNNNAKFGGGLSLLATSNFSFLGCSIQSNVASTSGGGIYLNQSRGDNNITNCNFTQNTAVIGGAIAFDSSCEQITFKSSNFQNNIANYGAAISFGRTNGRIKSSTGVRLTLFPVQIENCQLRGNEASNEGGSIYLNQTNNVVLKSTIITNDASPYGKGGAISANSNNKIKLVSSMMTNCTAAKNGGAIYLESSNLVFLYGKTTFTTNSAGQIGGAIFGNKSNTIIYDSSSSVTYSFNKATTGSALYLGSLSIMNSTVSYNLKSKLNFINNVCTLPGCGNVFWAYSGTSTNISYSQFVAHSFVNTTGSASQLVSQPVKLSTSLGRAYVVTYYNASSNGIQLPPVTITASDDFNPGERCRSDSQSYVTASVQSSHCGLTPASLSGPTSLQLNEGQVIFYGLALTCTPGGNVTVAFNGTIFDSNGFYNGISSTVHISYPSCTTSEQTVLGICQLRQVSTSTNDAYVALLTVAGLSSALVGVPFLAFIIWITLGFAALHKAPTHLALRQKQKEAIVLETIKNNPDLTLEEVRGPLSYRKQTALDIALETGASPTVIRELVLVALPVDPITKAAVKNPKKINVWKKFIQNDANKDNLDWILRNNRDIARALHDLKDEQGRSVTAQATPKCQQCLEENTYFLKRYVLLAPKQPLHESNSCMVHIAIDKNPDRANSRVALKFMKDYDNFSREITSRSKSKLSANYVIGIIHSYDTTQPSDTLSLRRDFNIFGFEEYEYLVVMPAADVNLDHIFTNENVTGQQNPDAKRIAQEIIVALKHIHSRGIIHGDIKPVNIMRMKDKIILIDMDASSAIGTDEAAVKYSSGFCPPELVYVSDDGATAGIKSPTELKLSLVEYKPVLSSPSFDAWSLGVVLYELFSGWRLFEADRRGNANIDTLKEIQKADSKLMRKKLNLIHDRLARNLVSQLLNKDSCRRPTMSSLLNHYLFKPKGAGADYRTSLYDVFISYRVAADADLALQLYEVLKGQGLRVFLDSKCLKDGENWEYAFCLALSKSDIFLPLISKAAINCPNNPKQNFTLLHSKSPCDNVLLEYRLCLELIERELVLNINPVMIGDLKETGLNGEKEYGRYFRDGSAPIFSAEEVYVRSVEETLEERLDQLGLGTPLLTELSVAKTFKELVKFQGQFLEGNPEIAVKELTQKIMNLALRTSALVGPSHVPSNDDDDNSSNSSAVQIDVPETLPVKALLLSNRGNFFAGFNNLLGGIFQTQRNISLAVEGNQTPEEPLDLESVENRRRM